MGFKGNRRKVSGLFIFHFFFASFLYIRQVLARSVLPSARYYRRGDRKKSCRVAKGTFASTVNFGDAGFHQSLPRQQKKIREPFAVAVIAMGKEGKNGVLVALHKGLPYLFTDQTRVPAQKVPNSRSDRWIVFKFLQEFPEVVSLVWQ